MHTKVSSHVIRKIETFIEEYTRYKKHCTPDNNTSVPFTVGTLGPHTVLRITMPSTAQSNFPEFHRWSEVSSLSKVILLLGKAKSCRAPNLGCRRAESPGWFDVSPKVSARDVMHERVHCCDEAANDQLPIVVAFWIIWIVSVEECSSLMQNLSRFVALLAQSFWMWRPHSYTCSLKGVYHPHWLQWSCPCSCIAFQFTLLRCQVTSMSHKLFLLH